MTTPVFSDLYRKPILEDLGVVSMTINYKAGTVEVEREYVGLSDEGYAQKERWRVAVPGYDVAALAKHLGENTYLFLSAITEPDKPAQQPEFTQPNTPGILTRVKTWLGVKPASVNAPSSPVPVPPAMPAP